ncbi:MAG: hypothetical protein ACOC0Q_01420 [Wenzhouxiangella sp.]
MTTLRLIALAALVLTLTACGTTRINTQAMEAYGGALQHQRALAEQHAGGCATAASLCAHDSNPGLCVVAAQLACNAGRPNFAAQMPQLRSPGEEFARGFSPVAGLLSAGLQVYGAGWLVDRSGRNAVDLVGAVGGVVGQVQGPVDNSVSVGGNLGATDQSTTVGGNFGNTDQSVAIGGDQIGGDRVDDSSTGGDWIGGNLGDDVSGCVGEACRATSPGPIDNSDSSDNSTTNPPPPAP